MYKLNKKNPVTRKLIELDDAISDFYATKLINFDIGIEENVSEPYLSSAEEQLSSRKRPILGGSAKVLI